MPDRDRDSITRRPQSTGGGSTYFGVGALVVAVLIGGYVLIGTPGLYTQVANAPGGQNIDTTVPQPTLTTAPAMPAGAPAQAPE